MQAVEVAKGKADASDELVVAVISTKFNNEHIFNLKFSFGPVLHTSEKRSSQKFRLVNLIASFAISWMRGYE
eukprot:SAG31_NODE_20895_length_563_cov_0.665948_1_plen_71_part_10